MNAKSIKGKSTEEIRTSLAESITDARLPDGQSNKPTLAICFISKSLDRSAITDLLDVEGISVFGCTTNGEFINETTEKESWQTLSCKK